MIYHEFEVKLKNLPVDYPDRKVIRQEVFQGMDDFVGTKAQIAEEEARREQLVKDRYREGQKAYGSAYNEVFQEFKDALYKQYGTDSVAVNDKAYGLAYEEGHSHGLHDIEVNFERIMEVAEFAYEAGQMKNG